MTDDSIALRALLEKSADADLLREMIGFAAERLMELEVQGLPAPAMASARRIGSCSATAIATGSGRPAPVPSSCASPSSGGAATSQASSSMTWVRQPTLFRRLDEAVPLGEGGRSRR
jgi:hypothetical protein